MPKNIVVCCDGTGNEVGREGAIGGFKTKTSNVLKLYRCLPDSDAQITHYNPGVGTLGGQDWWQPAVEALNRIRGLALGWGLDRDVLSAYRVIAESYRDGDRIYLFGFSRGAYTVRIVAGLIHLVGLLRAEQMNLAPYALRAYKRSERDPSIDKSDVATAIAEMDALATAKLIEETADKVDAAPGDTEAAAIVDAAFLDETVDLRLTAAEKARAKARAEASGARGDALGEAMVLERAASIVAVKTALAEEVKVAALRAKQEGGDIAEAIRSALGRRKVAATDYDPEGRDPREPYGRYFGRMVGARPVPIHFLGVWDTVGSVIAPGAFWLIPKFVMMAHLWSNPSVTMFRQAASIDEKRRMFRLEPWILDPGSEEPVVTKGGKPKPPPAKQVWFAGYHSDVGGGFTAEANDVSDFPLRWMIGEAHAADIRFDLEMVDHLLTGAPYGDQPEDYAAGASADPVASKIHNSMNVAWALIEYLPHWTKRPVWPKRRRWLPWGGYFPRSEPRIIPKGAAMHWSAVRRRRDAPDYCPANWPENWPAEGKIAKDLPLIE